MACGKKLREGTRQIMDSLIRDFSFIDSPVVDFTLPTYAARALDVLESAGFEAWVVGGWVRDALLGDACHDVDIASNASWQEVRECFSDLDVSVLLTGVQHGTVTVLVEGHPLEITTYRSDGVYTDHRHPDQVNFVQTIEEDLARRDFTVNAMAFHPARGLLDPYGGRQDLKDRLIRAVGDPDIRFEEDALRVLRALRFAGRLNSEIEPLTHGAARRHAGELSHVSQERIGSELKGILACGYGACTLRRDWEILVAAVPELAFMDGCEQMSPYHSYDVREHTARVCEGVEAFSGGLASEALRWAALFHDIAKPMCRCIDERGRGHFFGHPEEGARLSRKIMGRLALPGELIKKTCALIKFHDTESFGDVRSIRKLLCEFQRRVPGAARSLMYDLICLRRADALAKAPICRSYAAELDGVTRLLADETRRGVPLSSAELAVNGHDVIRECGIPAGPGVGIILYQLFSSIIEGSLENDRQVLLQELRRG